MNPQFVQFLLEHPLDGLNLPQTRQEAQNQASVLQVAVLYEGRGQLRRHLPERIVLKSFLLRRSKLQPSFAVVNYVNGNLVSSGTETLQMLILPSPASK